MIDMGLFSSKQPLSPSTPLFPPRWQPFSAHTFERKALPDPGAQNYAYENLGLFEQTFIGPAVANRGAILPLQPPQVYQYFVQTMGGVGGLSAGQMIFQPLLNPYSPSSPMEGDQ